MQAPLLLAVARGHSGIAGLLLQAGAHCNIVVATPSSKPNSGETLVEVARRKRDYDMLQVLTSFDACDPDVVRSGAVNAT
jgi:hypothetical protein